MDQGTSRTRDDLKTQPRLDSVDPATLTAVAADMHHRPSVLVCCPLAIEFDCVTQELRRIAAETTPHPNVQLVRRMPIHGKPRTAVCGIGRWNYVVIQSGLAAETWKSSASFLALQFEQVWLIGFAGALAPSLRVGDFIEPRVLVSQQWEERMSLSPIGLAANTDEMLTAHSPASSGNEKAALRNRSGCSAVDMEAFDLARTCGCYDVPFHTARAISDAADESLPKELDGAILPSGDLSASRLAKAVMKKPTLIGPLFRLWRNSRKAKKGLQEIVKRLVAKLA